VGVLAALAAIMTLYALQQRESSGYRLMGMVFSVAGFVGMALLLVGAVAEALAGPTFEPAAPTIIGGLVIATGGLLPLGIVTLLSGMIPRWCGALLVVGSPSVALLLFALLADYRPLVVGALVLIRGIWTLVGFALFRGGVTPTQ
jgi:hypothetical protein